MKLNILSAACLAGVIFFVGGCDQDVVPEPVKEEITWDYLMDKYFPKSDHGYVLSLGEFYDELDNRLGRTVGRLRFGEWKGDDRQSMRMTEASLEEVKAFCITRNLRMSQVFVFRKDGVKYVFAYEFITENEAFADRSIIKIIEPEDGVRLMRITYRNGSGTGVLGWGMSYYLLADKGAKLVFQTDLFGYQSGWPCADYNYRCDIKSITETWPRLELEYNSEWLLTYREEYSTIRKVKGRYELKADITMGWARQDKKFTAMEHHVLTKQEIDQIIADQVKFLKERKDDKEYLAKDRCPITFDPDATKGKLVIK